MTYSRRQLEAFGEPLGESITRAKPGGRIYGGGGSSTPAKQEVTQTSIPDYAKPYVERMLGKAEATTNAPYQAYGGERIAGFTPLQNQAFQGVANMQGSQYVGQGAGLAGTAGLGALMAGQNYATQATNPYAMQAYMSPYVENALAPQMREAARQSAIQGQQNQAQAVQQGAFGGARSAIVEAERQRNLGQVQSDIYNRGMQSAFDAARQAQQFGATLGLQGLQQAGQMGATLGQLGQTEFGQQKDILQGQLSAGAQQRDLEQQRLSQQYQDFLNQRGYQQQQLAYMSDMLRGLPLTQQTQQTYTNPSTLSQMAGIGGGLYSMSRAGMFAGGGLAKLALDNMGE